jgi:hypothetical protein
MPVEIRLMDFPESQREAAEAVLSLARRHKGVVVEAVGVGIFLKRDRTLVELRPKTKWLDVSFVTPDTVTSARIARSGKLAHGHWYVVHVAGKRDVDAELRGWLTASLRSAATKRT